MATKYSVPLRTQSACWLALAVLALAGCGSGKTDTAAPSSLNAPKTATATTTPTGATVATPTKTAPAPTTPAIAPIARAGSTVATDDVNGYSVTLPAGYERIKDKAAMESMMREAVAKDPTLKVDIEKFLSVIDSVPFFAVKLGETFSNNISVAVTPSGAGSAETIGELYGRVQPLIEGQLGAKITDHRVMDLAGTKALRVEYRVKKGTDRWSGTQVYLVHNGNLLILTISLKDVPASAAEANVIIDGLRLN